MSHTPPEHEPVLLAEVVQLLDPQPGQIVLDGTVGLGGHARALLPRILPAGKYIGIDIDEAMLAVARQRLAPLAGDALHLFAASYADFPSVLERVGVRRVDSMLLDLGVCSAQLDDAARGFSFEREGPLDMRFDLGQRQMAMDLVNGLTESELSELIFRYGQEPLSRKIARRICQARHSGRITTTRALAAAVEGVRGEPRPGKIHPATRVFQALRIAVNRELENLERFLQQAPEHLNPGGRLGVISFHSLEDGIVKRFIRAGAAAGALRELTRRPVVASEQERRQNPRSRSAKLRVAQRV